MKIYLLLLTILFSCTLASAQNRHTYKVDSNLQAEIASRVRLENKFAMGSIQFKFFKDDSLIINSQDQTEYVDIITMTSMRNDTVSIVGFWGMFNGFGFYLDFFENGYELTGLAKSDIPAYKLNKEDEKLSFGISVPCTVSELIVLKEPKRLANETIAGYVSFKTVDFWEVGNGEENKYRMEIKAYFKTMPLEDLTQLSTED